MAIHFWLDSMKRQRMMKQYEEGYRRHSEPAEEICAIGRQWKE